MRLSGPLAALVSVSLAAGALATSAAGASADPARDDGRTDAAKTVGHELFAPSGHIRRVSIPAAAEPEARARRAVTTTTVTPVEVNGPSKNRLDIVFLGDGYAADDQALFAENVADSWALLSAREPFSRYRTSFNVWRVDIVSLSSGVSGDPTPDVQRDTPLGATYWCGGVERVLCVDVDAARAYAALARDADQIAVIANSTKYGGAGYTEADLATFAGNNELAGEILPHELGHSLGDLGDEYDYLEFPEDGSTYEGAERPEANLSIYDAAEMTEQATKWAGWLGTESPDGGQIGTFEGGYYNQWGVFRPSENSLMKELEREFNSPSREKLIRSFYATATPIDGVRPRKKLVRRKARLTVEPLPTATHIRWYVNNKERRQWRGRLTVRLTRVSRTHRKRYRVMVVVSDRTSWVIDPGYRQDFLTESHSWRVNRKRKR